MGKKIDMTGWIMSEHGVPDSRITVLYDTGRKSGHNTVWRCRCSCGTEFDAVGSNIKSGHTKSCGCLNKEKATETIKKVITPLEYDLTGQDFGYWHVDSYIGNKKGQSMWACTCQCGAKKIVNSVMLRNNKSRSCGCMKESYGEQKIRELLEENNIPFESQKRFEDCKDILPLPFDFYVNNEYIIEFDGQQHFEASGHGWNTEEQVAKTKEHDKIKNEYCFNNNIPIIRIPYTYLDNICLDDLLLKTSKYIIKAESA